jgi:hypothetical protein
MYTYLSFYLGKPPIPSLSCPPLKKIFFLKNEKFSKKISTIITHPHNHPFRKSTHPPFLKKVKNERVS